MENDYSQTIIEQESMAFDLSVFDVQKAFADFGVAEILQQIVENPFIKQELIEYVKTLDK